MKILLAALVAAVLVSPRSYAGASAVVDGVQMPAWVERYGLLTPLVAGMELTAYDTVRTGRNARVLLKLGEGSLVRLGENGQLKLAAINPRDDGKGIFRATFEVLRGAFRFTTDRLAHSRAREVEVRIASITAGVRGTDLWGKAAEDRDVVCLIEGAITVSHEGQEPVAMQDPLSFYVAPKGGAPEPVQAVPLGKLAQWAQETDLGEGQGAVMRGGKWKLVIAQGPEQGPALDVYLRLRKAGFGASFDSAGKESRRSYVVSIGQIADEAGAKALATRLETELGLTNLRLTH